MNVLFVCTGNTCRSPMAEGLFKHIVKEQGLTDITCESAGLSTRNGMLPSFYAVAACKEIGVDISEHRSRVITLELIENADIIFAMSKSHKEYLLSVNAADKKIYLPSQEICDPYMGDIEVYQKCRDCILSELIIFIKKLT